MKSTIIFALFCGLLLSRAFASRTSLSSEASKHAHGGTGLQKHMRSLSDRDDDDKKEYEDYEDDKDDDEECTRWGFDYKLGVR